MGGDIAMRTILTSQEADPFPVSATETADGHGDGDVTVYVVTTRSQAASKLLTSGELLPALPIQGRR